MNNPNAKDNLKPFKKGKDARRNLDGRPKEMVSLVNDQLESEGFAAVSKAEIVRAAQIISGLPLSKIKEISDNKSDKYPLYYQLTAAGLLSKRGMEMMDRLLDRGIGKVTQTLEHTGNAFENVTINVIRK